MLDQALVLTFPGSRSATGEDLAELHCHGGRAVVAAVEAALAGEPGLRRAEAGEFTRRALGNGRVDLLEAEGLADLLEADTESQRIAAMAAAGGRLSSRTRAWLHEIAELSARVEAVLDYADEDDVASDGQALTAISQDVATLAAKIDAALASPSVERLREGVRVVIAGPPNAGKSTLLNLLAERDAAIVSPISGTTRDRIEAAVNRAGLPLLLIDTAGIADTHDPVEAIGVDRAHAAIASADVLLWLGDEPPPRQEAIWVHARSDLPGRGDVPAGRSLAVSAFDASSIRRLWEVLALKADRLVSTHADAPAMREHQRAACHEVLEALCPSDDPLLIADGLGQARRVFARMLGLDGTELMLDQLFSRFCVGK